MPLPPSPEHRRRGIASIVVIAAAAALTLTACEKPAPGVSVFAGTTTKFQEAICWAFDSPALEPGDCAQSLIAEASTGDNVPRLPVVPGETIGISVDLGGRRIIKKPKIGQQRLVSTPLETTYYRFTYPDLQEIPPDGVLLQVVAGRGDAAKGIWVFRLERS